MKTKQFLFLMCSLLLIFGVVSCDKNEAVPDELIGTWINPTYLDDNKIIFTKSENLDPNGYGFSFKNKGKFIEKKPGGWCGTPPIYEDFKGNWKLSNSQILITVAKHKGKEKYIWNLISVEKDKLTIEKNQ